MSAALELRCQLDTNDCELIALAISLGDLISNGSPNINIIWDSARIYHWILQARAIFPTVQGFGAW